MTSPSQLSRRRFLQAAGAAAAVLPSVLRASAASQPRLGMAIYGSKASLPDVLRECAEIGYENVEMHAGPGAPTDPAKQSKAASHDLRSLLDGLHLTVSGMTGRTLLLGGDEAAQAANLEAIKTGVEFARALYPENPPAIETDTGGHSADWEGNQNKYRDRMGVWAETAAAAGGSLGIKAHAGNCVDTVPKLLWLMQQLHHPALSVNYDYSHLEFGGISLEESLTTLYPYTKFIQVKDARMEGGRRRYLLPGEGDIDYVAYFRLLRKLGYTGPVVVEVSSQVVTRPNFDFKAAAKSCFAVLDAARRA